jgi:hypothetical protein
MDLHLYDTERHDITRHDSHPHWENDMVHNYAHGLSMSNHFALPTIILWKVGLFKHAKSHDL